MKPNKLILYAMVFACALLIAAKCNRESATALAAPAAAGDQSPATDTIADEPNGRYAHWQGSWSDKEAKIYSDGVVHIMPVTMDISRKPDELQLLHFILKIHMPDGIMSGSGTLSFDEDSDNVLFSFKREDKPAADEQQGRWLNKHTFKVQNESTKEGKPYSEEQTWSKSKPDTWTLNYSDLLDGVKDFGMDVTFTRVK